MIYFIISVISIFSLLWVRFYTLRQREIDKRNDILNEPMSLWSREGRMEEFKACETRFNMVKFFDWRLR